MSPEPPESLPEAADGAARSGPEAVPAISVIVPLYNVVEHIGACIASLQRQSFTDFEVIIINDGSHDGSGRAAAEAVGDDSRFHLIRQENAGLSAARNAGLEWARAPLIAFVDSDDRVAPEFLARMHQALSDSDAGWAACAIRFVPPDGNAKDHPGVHGARDMTGFSGLNRVELSDWREVVRLFPSVWNKLYRRELIEGLRFDEGLNYEDHAFYWRAAARTDHILHLSEPLYISTQGRPGQITRDGSERVFEQFDVLEILRNIILGESGSAKTGGAEAFAEIATRLTFERVVAIGDPVRRARFIDRAAALLVDTPVPPARAERLGVPASWCERLAGRLPLSVVVPSDGNPGPLRETLQSLAHQHLRDFETIVVLDGTPGLVPGGMPGPLRETPDGLAPSPTDPSRAALCAAVADLPGASLIGDRGRGVADARNRGLEAARGGAVLFLDAGDRLPPAALENWLNRLRRSGADMGFAGMVLGDEAAQPHTGLHTSELRPGLPAGTGPQPEKATDEGDPSPETEREIPGTETDPVWTSPSWGPPPPPGGAAAGLVPAQTDALNIHAHPSAKLFDRDFLLRHGLRFPPEPLSSWTFLAATLARAKLIVALGPDLVRIAQRAECRVLWQAPATVADLAAAVERTGRAGGLMPEDMARLFVRAVWEKANFAPFPDHAAREAFVEDARAELARCAPGVTPEPDLYVGPWLRRELGLEV